MSTNNIPSFVTLQFFPISMRCSSFLLALVLSLLLGMSAQATIFTVTSNQDTDGSTCGTTCTLRQAINAANNNKNPNTTDVITLGPHVGRINVSMIGDTSNGGSAFTLKEKVRIEAIRGDYRFHRIYHYAGGDYRFFTVASGVTATLIGFDLDDGILTAANSRGGAVYNNGGTVNFTDCIFLGNTATYGSAVYNNGGTVNFANCTFYGNTGGAVYSNTADYKSGDLPASYTQFTNSTFAYNTTTIAGAGIYNGKGLTILDSCTLASNTAPKGQGGGIYSVNDNRTVTRVRNSIIVGNEQTNGNVGNDVDGGLPIPYDSQGYNLIGDGTRVGNFAATGDVRGATLASSGLQIVPNTGRANVSENGGPTTTIALKSSGLAVNTGSTPLTTDQRGSSRPYGSADDKGAVEYNETPQSPPFVVNTTDDHDDGSCGPNDCTLREAIAAANDYYFQDCTINFKASVFGSSKKTINLTSLPAINSDHKVSIIGPSTKGAGITLNNTQTYAGSTLNGVSGTLSVANLTFTGSPSACTGIRGDTVTVSNCTFNGIGAGIACNETFTVNNCTFTGCMSALVSERGTVTVDSCTIVGNVRSIVTVIGTVTVSNSLILDNINNTPGTSGSGHNITTGTAAAAGLDPNGLRDNGGPTPTFALLAGSAAINTGLTPLTADQRGQSRPALGADDIGAFEYNETPQSSPNFVVNKADDHDDGVCGPLDCTLREAISAANANNDPTVTDVITFAAGVRGTSNITTIGYTYVDNIGFKDNSAFILKEKVSIQGPGANLLTINRSGSSEYRLFYVPLGATASISGLTLKGSNANADGGGVYTEGTLNITSCTFANNSADQFGGAVASQGTYQLTNIVNITDCTFTNNSSPYEGGAIYSNYSALNITGCTFTNNSANYGGAMRSDNVPGTSSSIPSYTRVSNSTFVGNSAAYGGGAIDNDLGTTTLDSCTIASNKAPNGAGGGIYTNNFNSIGTTTQLRNSIVVGNLKLDGTNGTDMDVDNVDNRPAPDSLGYNLVGTGNRIGDFNKTGDVTGATIASAGLKTSGGKALLANNGGPTQTVSLVTGSAAIDTGSTPLTTDQRGLSRPIGSADDKGALEFDPPQTASTLIVNSTDDHDDGVCGTNDCTLREAINAANSNPDTSAITFDTTLFGSSKRTLSLTQGNLPLITSNISITGPSTAGAGLTLQNTNNSSQGTLVVNSGTVTISNLTLKGGYIGLITNGGNTTVTGCTFTGNKYGLSNGSTLKVNNCTVFANDFQGLYNFAGTATLDSCTLADNGNDIYIEASSTVNVSNSLVVATSNIIVNNGGTFNNNGNNVTSGTAAAAGLQADSNSKAVLADNGGPTPTIALLPGSAAINTGSTTLTSDQRGFPRPAGNVDDKGAFEAQNQAPVITSVTITPAEALTTDDLIAHVQASDADGDTLTYSYVWKKNGTVIAGQTGATLPASQTEDGDQITVTVTATDGQLDSVPVTSAPVTIGNLAPKVDSVSPQNESDKVGSQRIFTLTMSDANGAKDIREMWLLINTTLDWSAGATLIYRPSTTSPTDGQLFLRRGDDFLPPITIGTGASSTDTLDNGAVKVVATDVTVTSVSDSITLTLPLTIRDGLIGNNGLFARVQDTAGSVDPAALAGDNGFIRSGTYTVTPQFSGGTNSAPTLSNLTPGATYTTLNGSGIAPAAQTFGFFVKDEDGTGDIQEVWFLANQVRDSKNSATFVYYPRSRRLVLRSDDDTSFLGGGQIGSAGIIENSQVKVDLSKVKVTIYADGKSFGLTLPLQAKTGLLGQNGVWLRVQDRAGITSPDGDGLGFVRKGNWNVKANTAADSKPSDGNS
ncbi:hypothetical protein IAD21_00647 [Abditibacteriota bacterium]|nr:hypothetical protein IAD21_00647 [Abditibacteriota bacterium]